MKTFSLSVAFILLSIVSIAQIPQRLDNAVKILLKDEQMKHAIMSLSIVEAKTNRVIYNLNEQIGLAPASTQKLFISAAMFDLLGKDYRYRTELGYDGQIENGLLKGNLYIIGSGDPSLGSWRYNQTKRDSILNRILTIISNSGIKQIDGDIIFDNSKFSYQPLPGGWIWDDIGNYYGAGTWGINWNENQYDLLLKPGKQEGDDVEIKATEPLLRDYAVINFLKTGKIGSGDNGYIYMSPYTTTAFAEGTIPAGGKDFTISGSMPNPCYQLSKEIENSFITRNVEVTGHYKIIDEPINSKSKISSYQKLLEIIFSPVLDSLNYWFLQKSINLYGEAMIKTIACKKTGFGSTEKGVELLKDFWNQHGIEKSALNIVDGSGLSPQNRVTTDALVKVLQYARTRSWYSSFYNALPMYNQTKMKSGTISGAKSFAGYLTAKNGTEYTFAVIINNYDGSAASIVQKMFKILDELK